MSGTDVASLSILSNMLDDLSTLLFFVVVVGLPCYVILRIAKLRAGTRLHEADQAALQNMNASLQHMAQRMESLERILDAEVPAWRQAG